MVRFQIIIGSTINLLIFLRVMFRAKQISKYILHVFIFQASLVRPLSEAGKLKLAGDMPELEFIVSQFISEYGARIEEVGDEYKALRAFR